MDRFQVQSKGYNGFGGNIFLISLDSGFRVRAILTRIPVQSKAYNGFGGNFL